MLPVTYLMELASTFTFASREYTRRRANGALYVTALIGPMTLIFDLLTSQ